MKKENDSDKTKKHSFARFVKEEYLNEKTAKKAYSRIFEDGIGEKNFFSGAPNTLFRWFAGDTIRALNTEKIPLYYDIIRTNFIKIFNANKEVGKKDREKIMTDLKVKNWSPKNWSNDDDLNSDSRDFVLKCIILSLFGSSGLSYDELIMGPDKDCLKDLQITGFEKNNNSGSALMYEHIILPEKITELKGGNVIEITSFVSSFKNDEKINFLTGVIPETLSHILKYLFNISIAKGKSYGIIPIYLDCSSIVQPKYATLSRLISENLCLMDKASMSDKKIYVFVDNLVTLRPDLQEQLINSAENVQENVFFFIGADNSTPIPIKSGGKYVVIKDTPEEYKTKAVRYLEQIGIDSSYGDIIDNEPMLKLFLSAKRDNEETYNLTIYNNNLDKGELLWNCMQYMKSNLFSKLLEDNKGVIKTETEKALITELIFDELLPEMAYRIERNRRNPPIIRETEILEILKSELSHRNYQLLLGKSIASIASTTITALERTKILVFNDKYRLNAYRFSEMLYRVIFSQKYIATKLSSAINFIRSGEADNYCKDSNIKNDFFNYDIFDLYFIPDNLISKSENLIPFISGCVEQMRLSKNAKAVFPDEYQYWAEDIVEEYCEHFYNLSNSDTYNSRKTLYIITLIIVTLCRNKDIENLLRSLISKKLSSFSYDSCIEEITCHVLELIKEHNEQDKLPFYVIEELVLNTCAYYRSSERYDVNDALELLKSYGAARDYIIEELIPKTGDYRPFEQPDVNSTEKYSSFINQIARLFAVAQDKERKHYIETGEFSPSITLTREDIRFSGTTNNYKLKEINSPTDLNMYVARWEIINKFSLKLMKFNATSSALSAPSSNSLAAAYLHSDDRISAMRYYCNALKKPYLYSTTQDYSRRKEVELFAVLLIEKKLCICDRTKDLCEIKNASDEEDLWKMLKLESLSYPLINSREKHIADIALVLNEADALPPAVKQQVNNLTITGNLALMHIAAYCQDNDLLTNIVNKLLSDIYKAAQTVINNVQPSFLGMSIPQIRSALNEIKEIADSNKLKTDVSIAEIYKIIECDKAKRIELITPKMSTRKDC